MSTFHRVSRLCDQRIFNHLSGYSLIENAKSFQLFLVVVKTSEFEENLSENLKYHANIFKDNLTLISFRFSDLMEELINE